MVFSPLAQFDVICFVPLFWGNNEISLTNLSLTAFLAVFLASVLMYVLFNGHLLPRSWQLVLEFLFMFIFRLIKQQTGKEGLIYLPLIFSLFTFILVLNLFSLLPFAYAVTSHIVWTLYFALSLCFGIFLVGLIKFNVKFLKLFVPEVPLLLYPMMIVLEIMSYIMRSFSLAIRLSANIIAGHTLVHILADSVLFLCNIKNLIVFIPFLLLVAILVLELGIAFLQAYIFVILFCMYLNDSLHLAAH
jgi:ATP synthase subunit 6